MIGGANSAGQAALFLASRGSRVRLVVRADDLGIEMSSYLATRILADSRIELHLGTEVVGVDVATIWTRSCSRARSEELGRACPARDSSAS